MISKNDEAYNGLSIASNWKVHFPKLKSSAPVHGEQDFLLGRFMYRGLFNNLRLRFKSLLSKVDKYIGYYLVGPIAIKSVERIIREKTFGIDYSQMPTPVLSKKPSELGFSPPLEFSDRLDQELMRLADESLGRSAPKIRKAITKGSLGLGGQSLFETLDEINLTGKELVHSCYFYNDDVIDMIADHIRKHA